MSTHQAPPTGSTAEPRCRLKFTERIGYASGDLACSMYWAVFAQFLMFFYTDVVGLGAASVATMFAITRLWDTMVDPVMGLIADRTRSLRAPCQPSPPTKSCVSATWSGLLASSWPLRVNRNASLCE